VSDGKAAHGSSTSVMEVTKAIEQIFPLAPNFAAVKKNAQTRRYIDASFEFSFLDVLAIFVNFRLLLFVIHRPASIPQSSYLQKKSQWPFPLNNPPLYCAYYHINLVRSCGSGFFFLKTSCFIPYLIKSCDAYLIESCDAHEAINF
jgi:hypothetical protein